MSDDLEICLDAPRSIRHALHKIGRSEDVSFSPDNRRLALACLDHNSIAIVEVEITSASDRPTVIVTDVSEYSSPCLMTPHGVDFLDDETVLVANRKGDVVALQLPSSASAGDGELTHIGPLPGSRFELLSQPGSIAIVRGAGAAVEVLICDNHADTVTTHVLEEDPLRVTSSGILLRRLLDFPDSVAISDDKNWIAISNHDAHVVMVYRRTSALSEDSDPDCILRGVMYPHGLRFDADGQHLFVADAGRPHVHIYARDGATWRGVEYPAASLRVMGDDIFELEHDAASRGPKGIAIDHSGRVLAVTFAKQPIAFFDISAMLERSEGRCPSDALRMSYELEALEHGRARLEARIARVTGSKSYRFTEPLRRLRSAWPRTGR